MTTLRPVVPYQPWETAQSFAGRLARVNGIGSTEIFCEEMGLSLSGLALGRDRDLERLAALVALPAERLRENAIRPLGERRFSLRGETLVRQAYARQRIRGCPLCLQADIDGSPAPALASAYGRVTWCLTSVRTCDRHDLALVEFCPAPQAGGSYDFVSAIAPSLPSLGERAQQAAKRTPSGLERYLLARLAGGDTGAPWLDAMPLYAAARTCEIVGAVSAFGRKAGLKGFDDNRWHRAGDAGFSIASEGPAAIDAFLTDLRLSHKEGWSVANGPSAWFGDIHSWLAYGTPDRAFDCVRAIVTRNLIENVPLGPGDTLFGKPIQARRLHSIRTAFLETGIHPTRLRKILSRTGHIPSAHGDLSDHEIVFDAPSTARLLERLRTALTGLELGPYLNTNRVQAQLLVSGGFIKPVAEGTDEQVGWRCFAREDVDGFLAALLRKAQPAEAARPGTQRIKDTAKRACCHSGEIVDLILSDHLTWVGRLADEAGFDAVLVDVEEVRHHVRGPELSGMTLNEAYKALGMNSRALNELVAAGGIGTVVERHPVNRAPLRIMPFAEVQRFREAYVSLFQAAAEAGLHPLVLKRRVSAAGVMPAFDPNAFRITLYARSAVAQALSLRSQ